MAQGDDTFVKQETSRETDICRGYPRWDFRFRGKGPDGSSCNPHLLPCREYDLNLIAHLLMMMTMILSRWMGAPPPPLPVKSKEAPPSHSSADLNQISIAVSPLGDRLSGGRRISMERSIRDEHCNSNYSAIPKEPWRNGCLGGPAGDCTPGNLFLGLSWPPRSYTCSFCKREFRSAQALGGHMNVHRRDRARMRESPPWEPPPCSNPDPIPNPKPTPNRILLLNLNSEPDPTYEDDLPAPRMPSSPICSLSHRSSSTSKKSSSEAFPSEPRESKNRKIAKAHCEVSGEKDHPAKDPTCKVLKRKKGDRGLHLEIEIKSADKEKLDLDLRLGYA